MTKTKTNKAKRDRGRKKSKFFTFLQAVVAIATLSLVTIGDYDSAEKAKGVGEALHAIEDLTVSSDTITTFIPTHQSANYYLK